jgi:uncharacterized membrane protein YdbT with pleckstrin-like domain
MSEKILANVGMMPKIQLIEYVIRMILVGIIVTLVATIVRFSFDLYSFNFYKNAFLIYAAWRFLRFAYQFLATRYIITTTSVSMRFGIIARDITRVRIVDIRSVRLKQSIIGRLLNFGSVIIGTADTSESEVILKDVANPADILSLIESQRP